MVFDRPARWNSNCVEAPSQHAYRHIAFGKNCDLALPFKCYISTADEFHNPLHPILQEYQAFCLR